MTGIAGGAEHARSCGALPRPDGCNGGVRDPVHRRDAGRETAGSRRRSTGPVKRWAMRRQAVGRRCRAQP